MAHGGRAGKGFQRSSYDARAHDREPTWRKANNGGSGYADTSDSIYVAQPFDDFLFPWEEAGSAGNPITIDEDECFSETMTPPAPQQPLQPRPALRSIENLQKSRQLFDFKKFCKQLLFGFNFILCN